MCQIAKQKVVEETTLSLNLFWQMERLPIQNEKAFGIT